MQNGIFNEVKEQELPRALPAENLNGHDTKIKIIAKGILVSFRMRGSITVPVENFYKGLEATKRTTIIV